MVIFVFYGAYLFQYDLRIIPIELVSDHPVGYHDYRGVFNVHTQLSTGTGTYQEIIAEAQEAGLDFISFSDLNIFEKPSHFAGYHNNLLTFVDGEYSYLNSRLFNFFATTDEHLQGVGRSQVFFSDLLQSTEKAKESGLFILAHPSKRGYAWSGEIPPGLDGIELINLKQIWQEAWLKRSASFFWSLLIYPFNDRLAFIRLVEEPEAELKLFDSLANERPTIAIAGSAAEARFLFGKNPFFRFPSYQTLFGIVSNHVLLKSELTGNAKDDSEKISQAIRDGQFYLSFDLLANPKGFNALVVSKQGKEHGIGSRIPWEKGMSISITLPHKPRVPFDVVVYKDGEVMMVSNSKESLFALPGPGVYRVKVRVIPTFPLPDGKRWVPWIYTNAFYIR